MTLDRPQQVKHLQTSILVDVLIGRFSDFLITDREHSQKHARVSGGVKGHGKGACKDKGKGKGKQHDPAEAEEEKDEAASGSGSGSSSSE